MKLFGNVEVNGITRIVVQKKNSVKVFIRMDNRDWVDQSNGKIVEDRFMSSRVRKMVHKTVKKTGEFCGAVFEFDKPSYRIWIHNETINIVRN